MISNTKFTAIVVVIVAILLVGCSSGASQDDLNDLESQITVVSGEVEQLRQQLDEPADSESFLTERRLYKILGEGGESVESRLDHLEDRVGANLRLSHNPGRLGDGADPWGTILTRTLIIEKALELGDTEVARMQAVDLFTELNLFCSSHLIPEYVVTSEIQELVKDYFRFEPYTAESPPGGGPYVVINFIDVIGC